MFSMFFPAQPSVCSPIFLRPINTSITPKYDILFLRIFILVGIVSFILLMRILRKMTRSKIASFKVFYLVQAAIGDHPKHSFYLNMLFFIIPCG